MFLRFLALSVIVFTSFTISEIIPPDSTSSSILLQEFDTTCASPDLNGLYKVISCPSTSGYFPLYYRQYQDIIHWIYYDSQSDYQLQGWKIVADTNDLFTGRFIAWCPTTSTNTVDIIDCYQNWVSMEVSCNYEDAFARYIVQPVPPGQEIPILGSGFTNEYAMYNGIWHVHTFPPSFSGNFTVYTQQVNSIDYYIYYNSYHGMWVLTDDLDGVQSDMIDISTNTIDSCSITFPIVFCIMYSSNGEFEYYYPPSPTPTTYKPTPSPTPRPTKWWDTLDPTMANHRRRRRS